jgi:hypothetical protein
VIVVVVHDALCLAAVETRVVLDSQAIQPGEQAILFGHVGLDTHPAPSAPGTPNLWLSLLASTLLLSDFVLVLQTIDDTGKLLLGPRDLHDAHALSLCGGCPRVKSGG